MSSDSVDASNDEAQSEEPSSVLSSSVVSHRTTNLVPKPLMTGSILGTRSQSGNRLDLQATGSFEENHFTTSTHTDERQLAPTPPPPLAVADATAMFVADASTSVSVAATAATSGSTPMTFTPTTPGTLSTTNESHGRPNGNSTVQPSNTNSQTSEPPDEELQRAMAMALAIQKNPHLSPTEIHALLGTSPVSLSPVAAAVTAKPSLASVTQAKFMAGRLSHMFHTAVATDGGGGSSTTTTSTSVSTPVSSASGGFTSFRERVAGRKFSLSNAATHTTSASTSTNTDVASNNETFQFQSSNPLATAIQEAMRTAIVTATKSDPGSEEHVETTPTTAASSVAPRQTAAVIESSSQSSPDASTATSKHRSAVAVKPTPRPSVPLPSMVRLTVVAWKRRGGMGKYSTSAWERRVIALQGSKLLYYRQEESSYDALHSGGPQQSTDEDEATTATAGEATLSRRSVGSGGGNWFDSAGLSWATTSGNSVDSGTDSITPRGSMDVVKEKATVHAAFGHSGAPSPFALSIKVRGETKWKLCFDRHATQMQWLSAISDVVVQSSVDTYNASLLEAVDPSNHSDFTLFQPPVSKDGAATKETTTMGHRLWMLERYRVSSHDGLEGEKEEQAESSENVSSPSKPDEAKHATLSSRRAIDTKALLEDITPELDHGAAQKAAKENARKVWLIPEDNVWRITLLINVALVCARASSTTISGFWYLVVFANFAVTLCLAKHPSWESVLDFVRAVPNQQVLKMADMGREAIVVNNGAMPTRSNTSSSLLIPSTLPVSGTSVVTKSSYLPVAGCSTVKMKEPTDPPRNEKGEMFAGWCTVPGEILAVRSHGYSVTKQKVPSPGELYECVQVDIFESPQRYPDMATRVQLPEVSFSDDDGPKTWRSPDIFIISIALPTDPPKMTKSSSDGGGYTVTMYYQMKQATRDLLRRVTADGYDSSKEETDDVQKSSVNAVRLLEEWIRRAPTDHKFQSRFKVVPNAHNLTEIGMPSWIGSYNGKPFLIKRPGVTGFLHVHPELSCVEFDISLHPFPYLAKQGICYMKESYFKKVLVSFGFVIEGKSDDELPECLIGLMQLCYPDPQYAIQASDFFNGTAPRSF